MRTFSLTNELWLPQSPEEVFPFFADAGNLERLTPPSLRFRILTPPPIEMAVGTLIDYRIRLRGIPMRWQSEITVWEPPYRFVDEQRRGPYRLWVHEHVFIPQRGPHRGPQRGAAQDGGTLAKDIVQYAVMGGAIVQRLFVASELERIFEYRNAALNDYFAVGAPE